MQRQLSPDNRSDWYDRSAPAADALIRWRGSVALHCPPPVEYYVYVLHFHSRYYHAGHYLGVTACLDARLLLHKHGRGARLMKAVVVAGITFELAHLWQLATCLAAPTTRFASQSARRTGGPHMNEQQWTDYLALLASHENAIPRACVGCWYEQHPAGEAFPGDRVSSTLCQQHLITLPGAVKRPEILGHRSYV